MAGKIPELKDIEAALAESVDEASARNAFVEYTKRSGLHRDAAANRLRQRLQEINAGQVAVVDYEEHYGKEGLTRKPKPTVTPGHRDAPGHVASTIPSAIESSPEPVSGPGVAPDTEFWPCDYCGHGHTARKVKVGKHGRMVAECHEAGIRAYSSRAFRTDLVQPSAEEVEE